MVATIFQFVKPRALGHLWNLHFDGNYERFESKTLPIACVGVVIFYWCSIKCRDSDRGTIAGISGQCIFFGVGVWYLHIRERRWIN